MEEATIIHFNSEICRTELPFIEYHIMNQEVKPISIYDNTLPNVRVDTYRAKIHTFKTGIHLPSPLSKHSRPQYKTERIALTKDAQYIVDIFLSVEKRRLMEQLSAAGTVIDMLEKRLEEERSMTLWQRFKRWINYVE